MSGTPLARLRHRARWLDYLYPGAYKLDGTHRGLLRFPPGGAGRIRTAPGGNVDALRVP